MKPATAETLSELNSALANCAAARAAFDALNQDTEGGHSIQVAKAELQRAERALNAKEAENEARARVGQQKQSVADLVAERDTASEALAAAEARNSGIADARESLRAELNEKHEVLSRAVRDNTKDLRALALQKYDVGLVAIRDALSIIERLDDRYFERSVKIPDISERRYAWSRTEPSPSVVAALEKLRPALYECSISLARLSRV